MNNQVFNQNIKYKFDAKLVIHIDLFIHDDQVLKSSPNLTGIDCEEEKISFFLSENWIIIGNLLILV